MDDEYANAGVADPKIVITTSRDPSSRLTQFAKVAERTVLEQRPSLEAYIHNTNGDDCVPQEMRLVFPNSQKINRGNYVIKDIVAACRANNVTDLILLHEHRGEPGTDRRKTEFAW